jgi:hypothetical protein
LTKISLKLFFAEAVWASDYYSRLLMSNITDAKTHFKYEYSFRKVIISQ